MHVLRLMGSVTWRVRNARYAHLLAVAFALVTAVPPLAAQRACLGCSAVTAIPSGGPPAPDNDPAFVGGPPARNGDRWRFTVMPGILSPTLGGAAAAGSTLLPAYHVNLTSHEAFADPAGSGVLYIEAASGPWSIALGGTYIDASSRLLQCISSSVRSAPRLAAAMPVALAQTHRESRVR